MASTSKIPEGYSTLTPALIVPDAAAAIDLYKKAFGAKEEHRIACDDSGKIMHACLTIGSSKIFLGDAHPDGECCAATKSSLYVYIDDVDSAFRMAKQAGMKEASAVQDMFWGDRVGCVTDSFGNRWTLATHVRDVSPEEMEAGKKEFVAKCAA
ncbi:MAG: VOC family protein [Alphaproteobacteria bacterium]|nr:VOC family protein [Alphaproteobacteria bacterium]